MIVSCREVCAEQLVITFAAVFYLQTDSSVSSQEEAAKLPFAKYNNKNLGKEALEQVNRKKATKVKSGH